MLTISMDVLCSPAKTNLFLRITRKREDGFHELASVFQVILRPHLESLARACPSLHWWSCACACARK